MGDPDVDRLVALVGDVDHFAEHHWGSVPLLRSSGRDFRSLLDVDGVEALLLAPARRPTFRLVRDGEVLGPERSTRPVRFGGARLDDVADLGRIAEAVHDGATVVVQALQRTWPPLIELCRAVEQATSHPVQANAYLSPAGSAGLARHVDAHDVLVLQSLGVKQWSVDGLGSVETAPGDVLYLPAGVGHSAAAQDDASLHITLGILRETVGGVLRRVLARAEGVDLDRPLPLGYARTEHHEGAAGFLRTALTDAAAALARSDPDDALAFEVDRARRRRRPRLTGQLRSVLGLGDVDEGTTVVARADQAARLEPELAADGRLVLELADRRLLLPPSTRPALERLLAGDPLRVGDLPGLTPTGRAVLTRRLVLEELLVVFPSRAR